jgi:thiamine-monophosphate kinase
MRVVPWNEDSLHRWLLRRPRLRHALERGNDAAVLARSLARPVVCCDQVVEGVHFEVGTAPQRAGWKACARALSDLAASAADPYAVLLALRAPREAEEVDLRALIAAVARCAQVHGAELVAGDVTGGRGPLSLAVTAIGELPRARKPLSRSAARPGQVVVATGAFGGSRLGRHLRFAPRLAAGRWLAELGATAMMDVSDGLALDLWRIARASEVAIDLGEVPIHRDARRAAALSGRSALQHALHDGEDHELVATLPQPAVVRALREFPDRCPRFRLLGNVRRGRGLRIPRDESSGALVAFRGEGGWIHGR